MKSHPYVHAAVHKESVIVSIPNNFGNEFTGIVGFCLKTGQESLKRELREVILSCVSIDGNLFIATALNGIYQIVKIEGESVTPFAYQAEPNFILYSITGKNSDLIVTSRGINSAEEIFFRHTGYGLDAKGRWSFDSKHRNLSVTDKLAYLWDSYNDTIEIIDASNGARLKELKLSYPPIEQPIVDPSLGVIYSCVDCTVRIKSWSGNERILLHRETSGSIAVAYHFSRRLLLAAFSGNHRNPTTELELVSL